ncbi:GntR family transcriptional regulator [Tropicimonas isoalkanivorans]|uniref:Transcriptional regulator, GntR family n=1 Tax=Tropicimonas isoalkanivorans TaxID=441112 RepID=A0A1I1DCJ6_9RHOB|nr:GntR family transcriptional regulator [Tropicimonas isoalkanivorans]SFB72719.1 transcriptional regulator, GntR family [Tropicimonas isoalkanivorans]
MNVTEFLKPGDWLGKSAGPRYVQLRRRIEQAVEQGILQPNSSLPPEREIAELTDLSRVTVRKAIHDLVDSGILIQRQGSGTFVRDKVQRVEQSLSRLTSFSDDMKRRGMETTSTWLERGVVLPSPEEVVALGLSAGDSVARLYRLRQAEGQPMALERAALPLDILPNPLLVTSSLYEVLEASGTLPVRAIQRITAVNLGHREAELLGVEPGAAGLSIRRTSYLENDRVVEFTQSTYRGDAYDFVAELRLANVEDRRQ